MSTEELEHAIFRETTTTFQLSSYEQDTLAVAKLIEQARECVNIFSHKLCPTIFDTQAVIHACEEFCLRNPRTHINILICDSRPISRISHRLLGLSHRLPSNITFKKIASDINPPEGDFICIDKSAYFHLPNHQHYQGFCNFSDAKHTAPFLSFFKEIWERSEADPELRSTLL